MKLQCVICVCVVEHLTLELHEPYTTQLLAACCVFG